MSETKSKTKDKLEELRELAVQIAEKQKQDASRFADYEERLDKLHADVAALMQSVQAETNEAAADDMLQRQVAELSERFEKLEVALSRGELESDQQQEAAMNDKELLKATLKAFAIAGIEGVPEQVKTARETAAIRLSGPEEQGGVLVRAEVLREMLRQVVVVDPLVQLVRSVTISRPMIEVPRKTGTSTAAYEGEQSSGTETSGTFGKKTIYLHPYVVRTEVSRDALTDPELDMESEISLDATTETERLTGSVLVNGNGVRKPMGFLSSTTLNTNVDAFDQIEVIDSPTANTNDIDYDILTHIYTALNAEYRQNAVWLFNSDGLRSILKLKDGNNRPLWTLSDTNASVLAQGAPGQIFGRPFYIAESMPSPGADALAVAFGDFRRGYLYAEHAFFLVLRDVYSVAPDVRFLFRGRNGGDVVLGEAIKVGRTT